MLHEDDAEETIRAALRSLRDGTDASLRDVLTLGMAAHEYEVQLIPKEAVNALMSKYEMDRDIANGGIDQVAWNHGVENTRFYAKSFRTVGAIENADLLDRLATSLEEYNAKHGDAISADVVNHFSIWRKSMGGPYFNIPEPGDELAEPLVEWVLEHASALPDPDGPLPKKPPGTDDDQ